MGFENIFNGIYFHHPFYVKTGVKSPQKISTYVAATTSISGINADNTVIQVTPVVFAFSLRQNTSVINVSQNFTDSTGRVRISAPSTDLKEKYERYRITQLSVSLFCLPFYQIIHGSTALSTPFFIMMNNSILLHSGLNPA